MKAAIRATLFVASVIGWAQFLPSLQADSEEEFDDYLIVEASPSTAHLLERSEGFLQRWPQSRLSARVHEMRFFAFRDQGEIELARKAAEEALEAAPDNLTVKAALAVVLAASDPGKAAALARETLTSLESFRVPRTVSPDRWSKLAGLLRAQSHMAIGIVRFQEGDVLGAIAALEVADRSSVKVDVAVSLRLGRLYATAGRKEDARRQFERVAGTGDPVAAALARQEIEALR